LPGSTTTTSLDLPSSSDPKGKKDYSTAPTLLQHPKSFPGPKEAQSSLSLRPTSAVRPIRGLPLTHGATSASLKASPPRPSIAHRTSASLEATSRLTELVTHLLTYPSDKGIKCQPLHRRARVGRRQATMPHSGCDWGPVHQLRSLLRHPQHCSGTVGTCNALCRRARHCSCHCAAYSAYFLRCRTLDRHGHDPRTRFGP